MWPFTSYPVHSPQDVDGKTYDYIVVGGGTAGCALASRLSEDHGVSVLLLERGHIKDNIISRMPLPSQNMFWTDLLQVQGTIWSEPMEDAQGRKQRLWTVNGIGGASRLNAMIWTRGSPSDFESWVNLGLDDWTWDKVEPYFRRLENLTGFPEDSGPCHRGYTGPIEIQKPRQPYQWPHYMEQAVNGLGVPSCSDPNDPASSPQGYYSLENAIDSGGRRVSAFSAFLSKRKALERADRLHVCTGTVASRLQISGDNGNGLTISGVFIRSSTSSSIDGEFLVKARREVILTCGAMTTPQLLLLSGIGPTIKEVAAPGLPIPLVKELPAVGANFSDHYAIPIMLDLPRKETLHLMEGLWGLWYMLLWIFTGRGWMCNSAAPSAVFLHSDMIDEETMHVEQWTTSTLQKSSKIPNLEIMFIPLNSLERPVPGRSLFSMYPAIVQPKGKGRLEITSSDPLVNPKITYPMLNHEDDRRTARLAARFCMRLAAEFQAVYPFQTRLAFAPGNEPQALRKWEAQGRGEKQAREAIEPDSKSCNKTWKDVTDEEIDDYVQRVAHTALHFCSTCPMGTNESEGVVDQKLMVFGFKNLRIADASVLPKVPSAHTMAPVLMIAERCADFIREKWCGRHERGADNK